MDDPEFIELRKKFTFGILIALVFVLPVLFIFINRYNDFNSNVLGAFRKDDSFLIFFTNSSNCDNCEKVKKVLEEKDINYYEYDINYGKDYDEVLLKLGLSKEVVEIPGLVYVKDKKMRANVMGLDSAKVLNKFLANCD